MKIYFTLFIAFFCIQAISAQTGFWSDNFETGSPTSGVRTPEGSGGIGSPYTSYFTLTDGSTVSQAVAFTGKNGTYYWAGEDHNAVGTGLPSDGAADDDIRNELSITWTGIDITGKSGFQFKGLFAANNSSQAWDNKNSCATGGAGLTNTDYIIVQYRIDGGAWTDMLRFFSKGTLSGAGLTWKYLYEDTDGDGCGDGTVLTRAFSEFVKPITGTGTTLDIRVNASSEGANEEWGVDNFRLLEGAPLPITLIDFAGKNENKSNKLTWATASEQNNRQFEIERSLDGVKFDKIGTVAGNGSSASRHDYVFIDNNHLSKNLYYRLKQVDFDSKFIYSKVIAIKSNLATKIKLYPNPVSNVLFVETDELNAGNTVIQVVDMAGKQMPVSFSSTGSVLKANLSGLTKGIYQVKVISDKEVVTKFITKD